MRAASRLEGSSARLLSSTEMPGILQGSIASRRSHPGTRGALIRWTCIGLLLVSDLSAASNYTGPVLDVRVASSPDNPGNVRVSILVSGATSCTGSGGHWYSYDLADGATSKLWGAILLAAISDGRNVGVMGTGSCDAYGIEEVSYIDGQ